MCGKDNFIRLFELFVLFIVAEEECARAVGAVPAPLAAEVHKNYVAEFQLARARFVMGNGAALAERHYGVERSAACAEFAHTVFQLCRRFVFGNTLFKCAEHVFKRTVGNFAGALYAFELAFVLYAHSLGKSGGAVNHFADLPF